MNRRAAAPTLRRAIAAALVCAACAAPRASAQQTEPDRPDITNGTHIVDIGVLQIEMGGLYIHPGSGQHAFGSPMTARLGLTEWVEVRIGSDGVLTNNDGEISVVGVGNTQIGAKLRLWADPGGVPVLSILPGINIPSASASKGLGSGAADYTAAFLTGTDLGRHAHVDVNYGIGAIGGGVDQPHFVQHLLSASFSDAISDNWNPYLEIFWFSRQDVGGGSVAAIDGGAIYELGTRYALDGGIQFGVSGDAPRFSAFGGITVIVGNVLGSHGVHARQRQIQRRAAHHR
jgi:Putative MetA-pathway of phenol degradation